MMSDEVTIIAPEFTPGTGGVADYTLRLVEELGDRIAPRFILPNEYKKSQLPPRGKILLQYSAYGFDRLGYPRKLLRELMEWRKTSGGLLVIMFHEIWAFWPWWNKNRLVQYLHRAAIGKLISVADAVFTSTPSQAEHLLKLAPQSNVQSLSVGSNIRRSATSEMRDAGCAIVFGLQPARIRTLTKFDRLPPVITKIISAGAQNSAAGDAEEKKLLERFGLTSGFEMRGALGEEEISQLLSRAAFALSSQDALSITKSGTFMACAAHELNIITTTADPLAAEPLCWLTSPEELAQGISSDELKLRAKNLRVWQERTASWPIIAERFAEALQL